MKKYIFQILSSLSIGFILAYLLINSYESKDSITVSKNAENIYYIQKGVYSDKSTMENGMKDFENYIYNVENNLYYTYIGISSKKQNAEKIKNYYKEKGYDTIIKEKLTDNNNFMTILKQYDEILSKTEDNSALTAIENQILAKYEEFVKK